MKKTLSLLLAAVMALSLISCGSNPAPSTTAPTTVVSEATTSAAQETTPKPVPAYSVEGL